MSNGRTAELESAPDAPARQPGELAHPLPAGMRDLMPGEARRLSALARRVIGSFELFGYERVTVPAFEYASVLERGLGALDPAEVLRFVEPETGEVVALRPDMTPQVARLVATRLASAPQPARLCYEGSVLRRRHQRARRHRQIAQAGIELLGRPGAAGDIEVLEVAVAAARAAGLGDFVVDLGHAGIAAALLSSVPQPARSELVEALGLRDDGALRRCVERTTVDSKQKAALVGLCGLCGSDEVWPEARRLLQGTPAEPALADLLELWHAAEALSLRRVVDLGELRNFAYYTGAMFQILAEGPGQAVGAGGRYDGLLARFDAPRAAAGFAFDLDNLGWALAARLDSGAERPRLLLALESRELAAALRSRGLACAVAPNGLELAEYARAWRYTHLLTPDVKGARLSTLAGESLELQGDPAALAEALAAHFGSSNEKASPQE